MFTTVDADPKSWLALGEAGFLPIAFRNTRIAGPSRDSAGLASASAAVWTNPRRGVVVGGGVDAFLDIEADGVASGDLGGIESANMSRAS